MKKTLKRLLLAACAVMVSVPVMAADVELKVFHRWPNQPIKGYMDSVIADFEAANPGIKIVTDQVLNDSYKDKIRVVLGSNNQPDVFFSWSGEWGYNIVRAGRSLDLTPILAEDPAWYESFVAAQIEPFTLDGKIYGLPWQMDGKAFFYNKQMFEEAGLSEPKTFGELLDASRKLQAAGKTPLSFGSRAPWAISHYLGSFNERVVPQEVLQKDYDRTTGEFTHPGYVKALEMFAELVPYMNRAPNAVDHETARNNFLGQRGAMVYLQYGEIGLLKDAKFPYGFFIFPPVEGGEGRQNTLQGGAEGWMISADTPRRQEAVKFLKFLLSPEMGGRLTGQANLISPIKGAVTQATATPEQVLAFEQILAAGNPYIWLDTALDATVADAYMKSTQLLLDGKKTPAEVMQDVQAAAKRVRESLAQ